MAAFSDEELTTFCYDNFRPVYEEFTTGMSRTQKVQRLVETCERRGEMEKLLARVERANPYQYTRFKDVCGRPSRDSASRSDTGVNDLGRRLRWLSFASLS